MPGTYRADIYINDVWASREDIEFRDEQGGENARPCLSSEMLDKLGVDFSKFPKPPEVTAGEACRVPSDLVPGSVATFDQSEQRLDISVPQAYMKRSARGYVDPKNWDHGVTAGFVNYNANTFRVNGGGIASNQAYLGLNTGLNVGSWYFGHQSSLSSASGTGTKWQDIATYVMHDLPGLHARVTLGDTFTSGDLLDSVAIRGGVLATDDRMLPESMRGYAPVVRGIANSNAKVTVRQNGVLLYETTVAPGPFQIDDLYPTGYGGDLDVIITESDGSIRTFQMPYAAVPQSLRPGQYRYNVSAGQVRAHNLSSAPIVVQATLQRGLNNTFTGYVGTTASSGYASALFGVAANTSVGAIGADITFSATEVPGENRMVGQSARLSYSKLVSATNTNFSLAAYRYSSSGFLSFNDALYVRDQASHPKSDSSPIGRQRHQLQLNVNQSLGRYGSVFASGSVRDYWNSRGRDVQFQVGYSGSISSVGYSLSATRTRNLFGKTDTQYFAQLSIPLGRGSRMSSLNTSVSRLGDNTNIQSTLSGSFGTANSIGYSVYGTHSAGASSSYGASANTALSYANVGASVGRTGNRTQSSLNVSGGIVAHPGGVTFSQSLGDTFAIVRAKGAEGAAVVNAQGVHVNRFGYAVVPYLSPYLNNTIEIDPKGSSLNVQLKTTSARVAPFAGAAVMLNFDTEEGRAFIVKAHRKDGEMLPFGASVLDESGTPVGTVGQANRILVRSDKESGVLKVQWGKNSNRECMIGYHLSKKQTSKGRVKFEVINAPCVEQFEANDTEHPKALISENRPGG